MDIIEDYKRNTIIFKVVDKALEFGWNRCAEIFGKLSILMTNQECYANANKIAVKRDLKDKSSGLETVLKGKRVYVVRESFDKWILKNEILSQPI